MADFRKLLLAFMAGALLFATVSSAATPYSCNATAVPTLVRSEGIAEQMGDILLNCSGTPGLGITEILANVRLKLSVNVTSNVLSTSGTPITDAVLLLDDGVDVGAIGPPTIRWRGNGASPAASQNIFQAKRISDTEIEWTGVYLVAPGTNRSTIRITNVRGYAAGLPDQSTIYATINITGSTTVPVDNNFLTVADTRQGLIYSVKDGGASLKGCEGQGTDTTKSNSGTFTLKFQEGFASAFRPQGSASSSNTIPGAGYKNESGFNPGSLYAGSLTGQSSIGQANQGTRLMARLIDIPSGVKLKLPQLAWTSTGLYSQLRIGLDSNGAGTGSYATSSDLVMSGNTLVYEVYSISDTSYSTQETVEVVVEVFYAAPGPTSAQVMTSDGVLAPLSDVVKMDADAPEPRFKDNPASKTTLTLGPCRTILLFPYITQQASFDTGIAIANTSTDPLETKPQSGACTLYLYGNTSGAPTPAGTAKQTTPVVPTGGHLVFALSGGGGVYSQAGVYTACASGSCIAPLFQGYLIAVCDFQYAHGYAFVSDYGMQRVAQGYLAMVIPDRGQKKRAAQDSAYLAGSNQGEGLGN